MLTGGGGEGVPSEPCVRWSCSRFFTDGLGSEVGLECGQANDAVGHIDRDAVVAKEFVTNNAADVEPQ